MFLQAAAASSAAFAAVPPTVPQYRLVTSYKASAGQEGMPGRYPGRVITVYDERCVDVETQKANAASVREMMARGMTELTGDRDVRDSWARFIGPTDVVGIKTNCSGAPNIMSTPEVVAEIVRQVMGLGVKPDNIYIYERFQDQMDSVRYQRYVPEGVHVVSAANFLGYDPRVYVECNFFGEDDTRSNLVRLVSERCTKIINVPNMKDHGASGVTGCLKNIAYGNFSNVARSHFKEQTNTLSFIGTLATMEPLRSRTVLHVMDGLRGVWHGGPFVHDKRFVFFPKQMKFGTDPVAIDRLLIDIIEAQRKAENAVSVWNRGMEHIDPNGRRARQDPNFNRFIREPGHIEYAGGLGLGIYDIHRLQHQELHV